MERLYYFGYRFHNYKFYESRPGYRDTTNKETMGMRTNAGTKKLSIIGHVKNFGKVWFDPTLVVNILVFPT